MTYCPWQLLLSLSQPELPECAFSITLQDGGEDLNTVSNIPALYICLCELTHVGQDKGAKPGWTRGDSTCERSTIPGWLEISTPLGSRFKSRTSSVAAKEVCGLFASLIIPIGCLHWEREKLIYVFARCCSWRGRDWSLLFAKVSISNLSHDNEKVTKNSSL